MDPAVPRTHKHPNQRRSQRVLLSIRIVVSGNRLDGHRFAEEASTSVVSAHGALLLIGEQVQTGQTLTIRNVKSGEERPCNVIGIGPKHGGKTEVGVEFLEASPRFWRVAFPPDDWSPRSPEAKPITSPASTPKRVLSK